MQTSTEKHDVGRCSSNTAFQMAVMDNQSALTSCMTWDMCIPITDHEIKRDAFRIALFFSLYVFTSVSF